tara:strand:+ start:2453 stop:2755 length:303 start_codon:yes stop_codon:yes gene_type:complete
MYAFLRTFRSTQFVDNISKKIRTPTIYNTRITRINVEKTEEEEEGPLKKLFDNPKVPNGRWNLEEDYNGSMSKIATKNNEFNNHDHCGGDLCQYPPKNKS